MANPTMLASVFLSIFIFYIPILACAEVPEVIEFEGSADGGRSENVYPSTYTGPVTFPHLQHFEEYADGCGDCHHDGDHEPLDDYYPDESYHCIDCHDREGLIRGPIAENEASFDDLILYRANVLHLKCLGCHKDYNAEQHVVIAPEACRICHTKRSREWEHE